MESPERKPLTGVWSEIDKRRVSAYLVVVLDTMRALRSEPEFWVQLGPALRVRFEDFQGDLAALRASFRK